MYKKFKDLVIGDVFKFCNYTCVKLADNRDYTKPLRLQSHPNALALINWHYVVIGADAEVEIVKERLSDSYCSDAIDEDEIDDRE